MRSKQIVEDSSAVNPTEPIAPSAPAKTLVPAALGALTTLSTSMPRMPPALTVAPLATPPALATEDGTTLL